jgi:hypothetical protein
MKLFEFYHVCDYGHDNYITIMKNRSRSLIQIATGSCEYGSGYHIEVGIGLNKLFKLSISFWKLYFIVEILSITWGPSR